MMADFIHSNTTAEEWLSSLADNSEHACLSDAPYGLKFMGKKWDYDIPSIVACEQLYRVLKPGAFALIFSGSRTYHRLACRLEDAGFEIRDCIMWLYGSGFPKGLNISKAFDKVQNHVLRDKWGGYNTVLKPAYEPIVVAMKPLDGSFTDNAEKWGVCGLNIDECRVDTDWHTDPNYQPSGKKASQTLNTYGKDTRTESWVPTKGRYPANIIISESVSSIIDVQSGVLKSGAKKVSDIRIGGYGSERPNTVLGKYKQIECEYPASEGGASRFFYVAKACPSDRNYGMPKGVKNTHPTVKPIKLMRYLARFLKQPKEGFRIIDMYEGSGTTGVACMLEGINYAGCEKDIYNYQTANCRITYARNNIDNSLF